LKRAFTGQLEHRKVEVWCLKVGNARKEMESINMNHKKYQKESMDQMDHPKSQEFEDIWSFS